MILCFDLSSCSLKDWLRGLLLFLLLWRFPRAEWIPGQCLLKAFKGKCRAAAAVAIATWGNSQGNANNTQIKRPGKEETMQGDTWRNKSLENSHICQGIWKGTHIPRTRHMPQKTWEDPKLSPLIDHWASRKQEVKFKTEFNLAKHWKLLPHRANL